MSCESDIPAAIRSAGHRYTSQRGRVLAALRHSKGHRTAEQLFDDVHEEDLHAGMALSTVYRVLASLEEMGLVVGMRTAGADAVFEAAPEQGHHHHLVCRGCGQVAELELSSLASVEREIRERTGFQPAIRHLAVPGWCSDCVSDERRQR